MCKMEVRRDGSLVASRKVDGDFNVAWSTAPSGEDSGVYTANLQGDGSMIVFRDHKSSGYEETYRTVRQAIPQYETGTTKTGPYQLVMEPDCVLHITGETTCYYDDDDGKTYRTPVWSNIRSSMTNTDVLLRGESLRGFNEVCSNTTVTHTINTV